MKTLITSFSTLVAALFLLGVIFLASTLTQGPRDTDTLKNIHGIFFYEQNGLTHVTEELAHFSLRLKEPSLAKQLHLTVSFTPRNVQKISVGPRKTPFWLSYGWQEIYNAEKNTANTDTVITETITIPLTDVLQHPDRSIDFMFKTAAVSDTEPWWELHHLETAVTWVRPGRWELREYINRVKAKERAL